MQRRGCCALMLLKPPMDWVQWPVSAVLKDYLNARASDFIVNLRERRVASLSLEAQPGPDCQNCQAQDIELPYKALPGEEVMLEILPITQDKMDQLEYQIEGDAPKG